MNSSFIDRNAMEMTNITTTEAMDMGHMGHMGNMKISL